VEVDLNGVKIMISRPILTKEIKLNKQVYSLELWSPANDHILDDEMPPNFQKDFFNEVGMQGRWPDKQHTDTYRERFDDWFDKLPPIQQRKYAKAIDESNRIIIAMVWDLVLPQDKIELFNNNIRSFNNWFSGLDVSDVDFYMSRIMGKQRLMPKNLLSSGDMLTEDEITGILEQVYDGINDELIRATTINGLLCISCSNESRLQKAKQHMVKHGSILRDYRKKQNAHGHVIYTYIFSRP
jgi:hemolysin-activating ACP:hemolysin acyltransferase